MAALDVVAAQLETIARNLRQAGEDKLLRELLKSVGDAVQPAVEEIRSDVPEYMPRSGGYADALSEDLGVSVVRRVRGGDPNVSIRVTARPYENSSDRRARRTHTGRKVALLNAGQLSHPLFGDREHWYEQRIAPGFVTVPARARTRQVRQAILQVLRDVGEEAVRKGP